MVDIRAQHVRQLQELANRSLQGAPSSENAKVVFGSRKPQRIFSHADLMPERRELATLAGFYNMHRKGGPSVAQCFMRRLRIKDS